MFENAARYPNSETNFLCSHEKFSWENYQKFIATFPEISGNLLNNYFHFIIFNYNNIKKLRMNMFLRNNSPDLFFNFMHEV